MSEYGCVTNTRTFAESGALYQTDMTKVFSGGLVYEYSAEGNGYGIVTISGTTVTPVGDQFSDLQQELAANPAPTDGGGYTTSSTVQTCPAQNANWDTKPFLGSALPATPSGAAKYFKSGAGTGPGLSGSGSQDAAGGSSATAVSGAGSVTATYGSSSTATGSGAASSASSSSAAVAVRAGSGGLAQFVCGAVVVVSFGLGSALL